MPISKAECVVLRAIAPHNKRVTIACVTYGTRVSSRRGHSGEDIVDIGDVWTGNNCPTITMPMFNQCLPLRRTTVIWVGISAHRRGACRTDNRYRGERLIQCIACLRPTGL